MIHIIFMSIPQPLPIPNHQHSLARDGFLLVGTNPRLRHIGLAHLPPVLLLNVDWWYISRHRSAKPVVQLVSNPGTNQETVWSNPSDKSTMDTAVQYCTWFCLHDSYYERNCRLFAIATGSCFKRTQKLHRTVSIMANDLDISCSCNRRVN